MLHFDSSHPIVKRGSRVSRAPPHHTLPAFLNLNGMIQVFLTTKLLWSPTLIVNGFFLYKKGFSKRYEILP